VIQRGEQRLIQRLGYPRFGSGCAKFTEDVFDVERHSVRSVAYRDPLGVGHRGVQRFDQRVGLLVGQRRKFEERYRPFGSQPITLASGQYHQPAPVRGREQRVEQLQGGRVEPVDVLGNHQSRLITNAAQQILLDCRADQFVKFSAFDSGRVITVFWPDAKHRCEQRHCAG
jgi:hypothetical protein